MRSDNYIISDYHQYRLYLNEANKYLRPYWRLAYKFKDFYEISTMEYGGIAQSIERIQTDKEYAVKMIEQ